MVEGIKLSFYKKPDDTLISFMNSSQRKRVKMGYKIAILITIMYFNEQLLGKA
jgi:hypothetical protein